MLTVTVDVDGTMRDITLMVNRLSDLGPVWRRFTAYMRKEIDEEFATGGHGAWAPKKKEESEDKKQARIDRIERNKYRGLQSRLRSEHKRATKTLARGTGDSKLGAKRQRAVDRKWAQIQHVAKLSLGDIPLQPEFDKKLYQRVERRIVQAEKRKQSVLDGQILGRMSHSFGIEVTNDSWRMFSRIPWAHVHNEGGTAGNGANIPKRTFLKWTTKRIDTFEMMVAEYIAGKQETSAA